jgi:hypothetical protein
MTEAAEGGGGGNGVHNGGTELTETNGESGVVTGDTLRGWRTALAR